MTTPKARVHALEGRYRVPVDAPEVDQYHALTWALHGGPDGPDYARLLRKYEAKLGTHPERVSLDDFTRADREALLAMFIRAYHALGWPVRDDLEQEGWSA